MRYIFYITLEVCISRSNFEDLEMRHGDTDHDLESEQSGERTY